jgi:predicted enzyme related to lactoylglutathione lyase
MPAPSFVWFELATSDPQAAAAFYERVLAVTPSDATVPGGSPYLALLSAGGPVGGVMAFPPDLGPEVALPGWTGYIAVDDVDAMAARVLAADGKMRRQPMDIPGVGRFAVMADPQGAAFNLFAPLPASVPPGREPGALGTVGWHELTAVDWKPAFEFYASLFGWTAGQAFDMGPLGAYQLFDIDGVSSGGMLDTPAQAPVGGWRFYFHVDAIDAASARIVAGGGQITMPAHQVPGGDWIVLAIDPQGGHFALMSRTK